MWRGARFDRLPRRFLGQGMFALERRFPLVCWVAFVLLAGCESAGLEGAVPVRGKVVYQGKPLTEGEVLYAPVDPNGRQARGKLQSDGTFTLTTLIANDGALPGEYRVVVEALAPHPGEPGRGDTPLDAKPPKIVRGYLVPEKYTNPDQTPFRDTVDGDHPGYREWVIE